MHDTSNNLPVGLKQKNIMVFKMLQQKWEDRQFPDFTVLHLLNNNTATRLRKPRHQTEV